jgi:hypothetical protein
MNVGDRVKTTAEWNAKYYQKGLQGTVLKIPLYGPVYPERNHYVDLDEQVGSWKRLWFDPNHLELE